MLQGGLNNPLVGSVIGAKFYSFFLKLCNKYLQKYWKLPNVNNIFVFLHIYQPKSKSMTKKRICCITTCVCVCV